MLENNKTTAWTVGSIYKTWWIQLLVQGIKAYKWSSNNHFNFLIFPYDATDNGGGLIFLMMKAERHQDRDKPNRPLSSSLVEQTARH